MKKKILATVLAAALAFSSIIPAVPLNNQTTTAEAAKKKQPSVKKIRKAIADKYGDDYMPDVSLTTSEIDERLGIKSSWYLDILAQVPMISTQANTLVIVKAKNKNTKKKVKKQLSAYREQQINDTMQYPMNIPKVQASRVYVKDNYVFFIMLGFIDSTLEETENEEQLIEAYKTENKKAVDAINALFKE